MAQIFRFYHDQLPDDAWRDFYNQAEKAIQSQQPMLFYGKALSQLPKDYYRVLSYVYNDHPELFYFNPYGCKYLITQKTATIVLSYSESAASMQQKNQAVNQAVNRILAESFPEGIENVSELRREKKIFDWLTKNVTYDYKALNEAGKCLETLGNAWTVYGALVLKTAVCQGIASAFKLLCDRMNMPSLVVLGTAGERHAWNIVRIDGQFYQVDCTWTLKNSIDLTIPYMRYQYLNITDKIMKQTHTPDDSFLPQCSSLECNPYHIKGLCCHNSAELYHLAWQHAANGETRFAFLCLSGYPSAEEQNQIRNGIVSELGGQVRFYPDKNKYYIGFEILRGR